MTAGGPDRERDLVLWAGNRMPAGLDERLRVAGAGGFTSMSLFPIDVRLARADGTGARDLAARAADAGCPVRILDPYTRWVPRWEPPAPLDAETAMFLDVDEREFFATAVDLGVTSMSVFEPFGVRYDPDELAEAFARVCDRAAADGLRVHLEPMPWSGVPDLATAWEVVRRAGHPGGGLVLDTWHFFRAVPDLTLLAAVPGDRVFAVQLADGPTDPAPDLAGESLSGRLLPGTGAFDLAGVVEVLRRTGGLGSVGPEVFSGSEWRRAPDESGRALRDATRAVLGDR